MYLYVKATHIIFVITWFAGLFYVVRLFIYNREAQDKPEAERIILQRQFNIMIGRLWNIITWPSCVLALTLGLWLVSYHYPIPTWLWIKFGFVIGLLGYHISLHIIYKQQKNNIFKHTAQQLRLWNEVATVFLVAIVMLVVVRSSLGLVWGMTGLLVFVVVLMSAVKIYKGIRQRKP